MRPAVRQILLRRKFDWFVDSVRGSDTNSGRTATAAFATLAAAVSAVGTKANQRIGLARGSSWKEQFVLSANAGTSVKAYGVGALPLIDGSDIILNASFALTAGKTLTYEYAFTVTGATGTEQRLVWEDGVFLTQVTSIANCESTAGSFFYSSYSASSGTLYVHATDGSNVTSNGKLYEFTKRYDCLSLTGDGCRVENIRTRRQRHNDGSLILYGDNCWMINCTMEDGHKHAGYVGGERGGALGCTFLNAYNGTSGSPNYLVFFKNTGTGGPMTAQCNTFTTDSAVVPSASAFPNSAVSSIICHTAGGSLGTLTGGGNTHTKAGAGYGPANSGGLNVTGDTFLNCFSLGNTADAITVNLTDLNVTINQANVGGRSDGFDSNNPASGRVTVNYVRGVFSMGTYDISFTGNDMDTTYTGSSITIGNTVSRAPLGALRPTGTGGTLTVNGCSITLGYTNDSFYNLAADTVYVGNNNTFNRAAAGTRTWLRAGANVASSLAAWQTYSSQDAASTAP
jgi:hypothetical protein